MSAIISGAKSITIADGDPGLLFTAGRTDSVCRSLVKHQISGVFVVYCRLIIVITGIVATLLYPDIGQSIIHHFNFVVFIRRLKAACVSSCIFNGLCEHTVGAYEDFRFLFHVHKAQLDTIGKLETVGRAHGDHGCAGEGHLAIDLNGYITGNRTTGQSNLRRCCSNTADIQMLAVAAADLTALHQEGAALVGWSADHTDALTGTAQDLAAVHIEEAVAGTDIRSGQTGAVNDRTLIQIDAAAVGGNRHSGVGRIGRSLNISTAVQVDRAVGSGGIDADGSTSNAVPGTGFAEITGNSTVTHDVYNTGVALDHSFHCCCDVMTVQMQAGNATGSGCGQETGILRKGQIAIEIVVTTAGQRQLSISCQSRPGNFLLTNRTQGCSRALCKYKILIDLGCILFGLTIEKGIILNRDLICFRICRLEVRSIVRCLLVCFGKYAVSRDKNACTLGQPAKGQLDIFRNSQRLTGDHRCAGKGQRAVCGNFYTTGNGAAADGHRGSISLRSIISCHIDAATFDLAAVDIKFRIDEVSRANINTASIAVATNGCAIIHVDLTAVIGDGNNGHAGGRGISTADQIDSATGNIGVDTNGSALDITGICSNLPAAGNCTVTHNIQGSSAALEHSLGGGSNIMTV